MDGCVPDPIGQTSQERRQRFFSILQTQGLVFEALPQDLYAIIYFYWLGKFREKGTIKASYSLKWSFGTKGHDPDQLYLPRMAIVDDVGNFFVADGDNNAVKVFSPTGQFLRQFDQEIGRFNLPFALAFDFDSNLVVLDCKNNRVQILDPLTGRCLLKFSGETDGEFYEPYGLTIGAEGNILVSDDGNDRVQMFSPSGQWIKTFGKSGSDPGEFDGPAGIDIDVKGNIAVCERGTSVHPFGSSSGSVQSAPDASNHRVQLFDSEGNHIKMFGGRGEAPGKFYHPWGLCIDAKGNYIVADQLNARVQIFNSEGEFLMTFGGDGTDEMKRPYSAVLDKEGNIIVVDRDKHQIQIWG